MNAAHETGDRYDKFKEALSAAVDDAVEAVGQEMSGGLTPSVIAGLTHRPI